MRKTLAVVANWTVPGIIGAIFGGLATLQITNIQNQIRYIDFDVNSDNLIDIEQSTKNIPNERIKVIFENDEKNPIKTISQVKLNLFNFSDQDYTDVELYIEISSNNNKKLKIIPSLALAGLPENVEEKSKQSNLNDSKSSRYGYKIKILNRTEKLSESAFEVIYTIIGEKSVNIKVKPKLVAKGIKLREFSYEHLISRENKFVYLLSQFPILIIILLFIIYIILCYLLGYCTLWLYERFVLYRRLIKSQNDVIKALNNKLSQPGEIDELKKILTPDAIAEYFVKANYEICYKSSEKELMLYIKEKLSQSGEIDKFTQSLAPSYAAEYFASINKEFEWNKWKNTPLFLRILNMTI